MKTIRIMICAFIVIFVSDAAFAKIYRLKDKDGNYYYKDIPEAGDSSAETVQLKTEASIPGQKDLAAALSARFNPKSAVEKASMATVTVKTAMGAGSGFLLLQAVIS